MKEKNESEAKKAEKEAKRKQADDKQKVLLQNMANARTKAM